ncbi:hypothetical protein D3Z39_07790 [Anaerotruncus colihominis]|uniref:Uncharacterized protein n=1 Tax=Anaerotruncus colihominis TaxID=169435 RepID=A0A845RJ36_9FIRM|nr:hypothetical protein [Anaerotruncus colihominis]
MKFLPADGEGPGRHCRPLQGSGAEGGFILCRQIHKIPPGNPVREGFDATKTHRARERGQICISSKQPDRTNQNGQTPAEMFL